jgi:hypothetical protein
VAGFVVQRISKSPCVLIAHAFAIELNNKKTQGMADLASAFLQMTLTLAEDDDEAEAEAFQLFWVFMQVGGMVQTQLG